MNPDVPEFDQRLVGVSWLILDATKKSPRRWDWKVCRVCGTVSTGNYTPLSDLEALTSTTQFVEQPDRPDLTESDILQMSAALSHRLGYAQPV
jgi:hypothetical protein